MVSISSSIAATAIAVAVSVSQVQGHGYMLIPESQFTGSATSSWIAQIDPPTGFESDDWDGNKEQSVETWETLSAENGVTDLRTLLDGNTTLYGVECGYTDPDGTAQPIPDNSSATFSRAIQHVGPCEIWLDDTRVFNDTNCYADYGNEDKDVKSVFPVDYSQCETTGCSMMRFYWLAFQGVDGETVWQTYKDCIPLEGGSGTGSTTSSVSTSEASSTTSSSTTSTTSSTSTASSSDDDLETDASTSAESSAYSVSSTDAPATTTATSTVAGENSSASAATSTDSSSSTSATPSSDSSASTENEADSTTTTEAPATTTSAPSSKCTARERKRV